MQGKNFICIILCGLMLLSIACVKEPYKEVETPKITEQPTQEIEVTEEPKNPEIEVTPEPIQKQDIIDFDKYVSKYLEEHGYKDKNYFVSALSFRAALCLAIIGAEGETQQELIKAAGFESEEDAINWYTGVLKTVEDFNRTFNNNEWYDCKFSILNSVWNNLDRLGNFSENYLDKVKNELRAEAYASYANEITEKINKWCNDNTNGLIPSIADDLSYCAAALINALYLKSTWECTFYEGETEDDIFYGLNKESTMPFMSTTDYFYSTINDDFSIIVLPLLGDKQLVIVTGNCDLDNELKNIERHRIHLRVPKFEQESSYNNNEFIALLRSLNVNLAFEEGAADFSYMNELNNWYISDIIQKTRIKVNEKGLEAAAVTAIIAKDGFMIDENEIIELTINKPFKYYIYSSGLDADNALLLFNGQFIGE